MKSFFITTPIYYVNAKPHLGHAYTTVVADSLARFHKLLGDDTLLLTGTDEHGDKIVQAAEKKAALPKNSWCRSAPVFRNSGQQLAIANDRFVRTTDETHKRSVQDFLQRVYDAGDIYFGEFGGHYCYGCERFYTEKELENGSAPSIRPSRSLSARRTTSSACPNICPGSRSIFPVIRTLSGPNATVPKCWPCLNRALLRICAFHVPKAA